MADFRSFFPDRAMSLNEEGCALSPRFMGEEGQTLVWRAKPVTQKQAEAARNAATVRKNINGSIVEERRNDIYALELITRCVTYPDLLDASLQEAWGVRTPQDLIGVMLLPGEFNRLAAWVGRLCGFDKTLTELVDTAKN